MSLQRFHDAQANQSAGYNVALAEIRRGRKSSHWIWYIFPQLTGLGHSSTALYYAIRDLDEAREFLRDPVLRARFTEIATAVRAQLARGIDLDTLMGGHLDAVKLISSLTLFCAAAESMTGQDVGFDKVASLCKSILVAVESQSYSACPQTLKQIGASRSFDAARDDRS